MSRVLPYFWYPALFAAAIAIFATMLGQGSHLLAAMYVPIALVAIAIVGLEYVFPARQDWKPRRSDVMSDALFMVFIQGLLPRVLAAALALAISAWTHAHIPSPLWPHQWPLFGQAILMVLAVDFLRYWLHRACHTFSPLWRLHEVHHSPDILYTLNVGRFHPLEKLLHFSLDTVPFVLLGVAPEVVAAYFLFYAVNGFFQHSNLRLRYGFLNYVVGSAETHRWHHARDPKVAYCNFGNTTIVWDLLFRTWYLPKDRSLEIGIPDRDYPRDFWSQMFTPFRRGTTQQGFKQRMADLAIALQLRWTRLSQGRRIAAAARDPMRVQYDLLARIVRQNRDTTFGRRHGFAGIDGYAGFARSVPVNEYEALRPYVEAEIERGERGLTAEAPMHYLRTSGTTGKPKDIPLVDSHLHRLRLINRLSVSSQHRVSPAAFSGSILVITSPATEGRLGNGKPYGSASGVVSGSTPPLVREKFVLPAPVLTIADSHVKYLLVLRLALARPDITYLGTANPSTVLALMKLYRENESALVADLRNGGFFLSGRVPAGVLAAVQKRLRADPQRAAAIEKLAATGARRRIADLWPKLRLVVTWTCASAGIAADALREELSPRTRIHELGYVSSEFRGTVTIGRRAGSGLPTWDTHFFEFVEKDAWDRGEPEFLTLDRLCKGGEYYVIVTTPSGLYRYFINDLVRVTGFLHRMPLLKFMQKGKGVTSITGEKLYESQVLAAVRHSLEQIGRTPRFVMMLADEAGQRYRLYVETDAGEKPGPLLLAQMVDAQLRSLNVEYDAKRESGRLPEIAAAWLSPGTEDAYKQASVQQGQREGQFKVVALAYKRKFTFDLEAFVEGGPP
ncbi:MAG TPA: GH3 auxin-responsive promoter family protein [Burkholderiales bacterium]